VKRFAVTVAGVTVAADHPGEALEIAGDLIEAAGADAVITITINGEVDEVLTELAGEGMRPVCLG
jgi:hypothetical protein